MSVHKIQRKGGTAWRAQWRDERGHQRSQTFGRKRDADTFDAKVKLMKRQGELAQLDSGRQTFEDFVGQWRKLREPNLAAKTRLNYEGLLRAHLLPRIGDVSLRALTAERIQQMAAEMAVDGVPADARRKTLTLLHNILEWAARWQKINHNPARYVEKPRAERTELIEPVSPRQVEQLREAMLNRGWLRDATLVSVMAYAGLRPGEALALRWGDVQERTLRIDKALSLGEEKATKTRQNRTVQLLTPLAADLAEWRLASGRPANDARIFPTPAGQDWALHDYQNWRRRKFNEAATDAGLSRTTPYVLRHSFASLLLAEGMNVAEIAAQLGHSVQVLLSTYAHVVEELRGLPSISAAERIRVVREGQRARLLS